jgi:hypothetical protein
VGRLTNIILAKQGIHSAVMPDLKDCDKIHSNTAGPLWQRERRRGAAQTKRSRGCDGECGRWVCKTVGMT